MCLPNSQLYIEIFCIILVVVEFSFEILTHSQNYNLESRWDEKLINTYGRIETIFDPKTL